MSLRPRLKMVADMVRRGSRIADIGTDHGYLPAWLVKSGKCSGGVAADLRKSPLENAAETLRIYGVEDKVSLRLSDGLDSVSDDEYDDVVLAGMGGTLISEILRRNSDIKDKSKRIIVQPNSHSEDVRKFFCENGFRILTENACVDDRRDYLAFCAEYTDENKNKNSLYYYLGCHPIDGNEASLRIAKRKIKLVRTRFDALEANNVLTEEYYVLKKVLAEFEEAKPWRE